jgi:hypothetical protein
METEITIEYGKKLKGKRLVHQELLCCHSKHVQYLFQSATAQRDAYSEADNLRKQLKEFVYPRISDKTFDETHSERKACPRLRNLIIYSIHIIEALSRAG